MPVRSDRLEGGAGNDIYEFGLGDGSDSIINYDTAAGRHDVLRFLESINPNDLWFSRSGSNLQISVVGSSDQVVIQSWYSGSNYQLNQIEAGSSYLLNSQVDLLVSAMASFGVPSGAGDVIPQQVKDNLQPVLAEVWQTT